MAKRTLFRRHSAQQQVALASPYIQKIAFFDVLTEDEMVRIDQQVDWMIENIGVAFGDDPVALEIWRSAGITPSGPHGDLIKADAQWIRSLVAKAPKQLRNIPETLNDLL